MAVDDFEMKLCGGTFFTLLTLAKNPDKTNTDFLKSLVRLYYPYETKMQSDSYEQATSKYRNCKVERASWMPFYDEPYFRDFNGKMLNDYAAILSEFCEVAETYFLDDEDRKTWLVRAIMEVLESDKGISLGEEFYLEGNGKPSTKNDILISDAIVFEPFLLGVWHYIIRNKIENISGRKTIEYWYDNKEPRAEGNLKKEIGCKKFQHIAITHVTCPNPIEDTGLDMERQNVQINNDKYAPRKILYPIRQSDGEVDKLDELLSHLAKAVLLNEELLEYQGLNLDDFYVFKGDVEFSSVICPEGRNVEVSFAIGETMFKGITSLGKWKTSSTVNNLMGEKIQCLVLFTVALKKDFGYQFQCKMIEDCRHGKV